MSKSELAHFCWSLINACAQVARGSKQRHQLGAVLAPAALLLAAPERVQTDCRAVRRVCAQLLEQRPLHSRRLRAARFRNR